MPGAFDRGNYSRTSSTGLLREPSICSDALTRDIFSNIEETLNKGWFWSLFQSLSYEAVKRIREENFKKFMIAYD